jgi:hypothetical protein
VRFTQISPVGLALIAPAGSTWGTPEGRQRQCCLAHRIALWCVHSWFGLDACVPCAPTPTRKTLTWEISNAQNAFWENKCLLRRPHDWEVINLDAVLVHVGQPRVDHLEQRTRSDVALHPFAFL